MLLEMESCYLKALNNCKNNNCNRLSGAIMMEMAFHLMEFEDFPLAFEYFQKGTFYTSYSQLSILNNLASSVLHDDVYQQKIILDSMCQCVRRLNNFDEALYDTTLIYTNLTKTET